MPFPPCAEKPPIPQLFHVICAQRISVNRLLVDSRFRPDPGLNFGRPELKSLTALWHEKRANCIAPDRADFDPLSLREYLSRIIIYEVVGTPPQHRFRFRSEEHTSELQSLMRKPYAV